MNKKILFLHGPNLNLLGIREPQIYGNISLDQINTWAKEYAKKFGIELQAQQSNHEGNLIDALHQAKSWADGIIFNPGAYSHTSIALHDAIKAIEVPVIEVHLSNIHARENFRHNLVIAPACLGQICGLGWRGYFLAIDYFLKDWKLISDYTESKDSFFLQ